MQKFDVFGIGTALVDFFAETADDFLSKNGLTKGATNFLPREKLDGLHQKLSKSIFLQLPGDNARNTCEGVSCLGGKAAYASSVAEDPEGDSFLGGLRAQRIESFVVKQAGRTGKIIALITPDGQRTFAADLGNSLNYDVLPKEGIESSLYLYLTSITMVARGRIGGIAAKAMGFARKKGLKIAASLESPPMIEENREKLLKAIDGIDVLFANEEELTALSGGATEAAPELSKKVGVLYLKKGINGSTVFSAGDAIDIPRYSKKTVDTTGAGDFYAGGVIYGLSHGKSYEEAGHVGAKLAGKVVERFGASVWGT